MIKMCVRLKVVNVSVKGIVIVSIDVHMCVRVSGVVKSTTRVSTTGYVCVSSTRKGWRI